MKAINLSRREFLWLSALSLGTLAASPFYSPGSAMVGRVTRRSIYAYDQPDLDSRRLCKIERDTLLDLQEEVASPHGPEHNPRWYRIDGGYVHSASIQRVESAHLNKPLASVPEAGRLGEVTVPFSQTLYKNQQGQWMPLYRLYFGSVHWLTGLKEMEDGKPWYRLTDEWLRVHYYTPAENVRPVDLQELTSLSPGVPSGEKRIEVSLAEQTLTAYEGGQVVLRTAVSTGKRYMETPAGEFTVNRKMPSKHMGNGALTGDIYAYELPGVPWVSFFHDNGVAFHGTYWHDDFGAPTSHGCVNMCNEAAKWLFRWCAPAFDPQVEDRRGWASKGEGTVVKVY
jgi:lipoprotein-anchoring transpeptidase ErfK/SrfK